jgi:hypothetical protein
MKALSVAILKVSIGALSLLRIYLTGVVVLIIAITIIPAVLLTN